MAAQVTVLDLTRRHVIKVSPGMYMSEVRDEACRKSHKSHTNFDLKSNGKSIDLSQAWRQCGLSAGAKLELVESSRTPSAISVALQLPPIIPGGRLTDKVRSDATLWHLLRRFEKTGDINITQRGIASIDNGASGTGRLMYEMPRLNITGRDVSTFADLQKTLAQLGFNGGNVLIKLDFIPTQRALEEVMAEIGEYFKEHETPLEEKLFQPEVSQTGNAFSDSVLSLPSPQEGNSEEQPPPETVDSAQEPKPPTHHPVSPPDPSRQATIGPNQRSIIVFAPTSSDTPIAATLPHREADYEPSVDQWKRHQEQLAKATINKRLLSDAEEKALEDEKAQRFDSIAEVKIKIRFPDQTVVLDTYTATDTAADLHSNVRLMIIAEDQPFKLIYTSKGPQMIPDDANKKLIKHLGFGGNMLINFHWDDAADANARKPPILKKHIEEKSQQAVVPVLTEYSVAEHSADETGNGKGSVGKRAKNALPKWMKGLHRK